MELLFIIPLCKKERAFLPLFLTLFKEDIALHFVVGTWNAGLTLDW